MTGTPLPPEVTDALRQGKTISAIRSLRETWGIDLKDAKDAVDAYQAHDLARLEAIRTRAGNGGPGVIAAPAHSAGNRPLPADVVGAMREGRKLDAIRLLRKARGIDLHTAKQWVEEALPSAREKKSAPALKTGSGAAWVDGNIGTATAGQRKSWLQQWWLPLTILTAFTWALVSVVTPVSALLVLANRQAYVPASFRVEKLIHDDDRETGLMWGFVGTVNGVAERYYAPSLADAKQLGYLRLRAQFPPGTELPVWYNAAVTDTLFQRRSIRVLPYVPDLVASETGHITWWLSRCLLPLVLILILASWRDKKRRR